MKKIEVGDIITLEVEVRSTDETSFSYEDNMNYRHYIINNDPIIKDVKKKPFDWDNVKAGMAFIYHTKYDSEIVYYMARNLKGEYLFFDFRFKEPLVIPLKCLTRAPKKDLCDDR